MSNALATALLMMIAVNALPAGEPAVTVAPGGIVKKVLDNGLTLIVKPEPGCGLVAVEAVVKAGAAQETIQNAGIGEFVTQLLLASTRPSSAEEIASVADQVGGNVEAQWHEDFTEIRAITTSAMFNKAMKIIGECLTEASFESQWVEKARADLLKRMDAETDDVFSASYVKLREMLYEDNGYRRPALGFRRTIKTATPEDLKKFYDSYFVPNNIVITVVGDVTFEQALDRAEKMFAGVLAKKLPLNRGVPDETLERAKLKATEADLPAAYLLLGWLAPSAVSKDYPAMAVAVNALGGGKGSLMFRKIRQERGMGYDLGVVYPKLRYQSHVVAYIITDPFKLKPPNPNPTPVLDEVKSALLEQVDVLKRQPLSEKDLRRAKGFTIGSLALQQQRLIDRALQLCWYEAVGSGYEMYTRLPEEIEKVTAQDVQRVANDYFGNYAAYLVIPRSKSPAAGKPE